MEQQSCRSFIRIVRFELTVGKLTSPQTNLFYDSDTVCDLEITLLTNAMAIREKPIRPDTTSGISIITADVE
jgi:hypothetical protein